MPTRCAVRDSDCPLPNARPDSEYGIVCGKICPAGQLRQRFPISQATIFSRCAAVKLRGTSWTTMPTADRISPTVPATTPSSSSNRSHRPLRRLDLEPV